MSQFLTDAFHEPVVMRAVLAGVLASVACGIVGSYVAVRRIGYIAGSIAHSVIGGLGIAIFLAQARGMAWIHPMHGAVAAALISALVIGFVTMRAKEREDTIIGAIWAIGMAVGLLFAAATPGYTSELVSYLFGSLTLVPAADIWLLLGLDIIVVAVSIIFYDELMAICFDEEFAALRGVPVQFFYLLLLCLTALTVVLLVSVVGIILVIALLTLPVAAGGRFARSLWQMMIAAVIFSLIFTVGGQALAYGPGMPTGPYIVLLAACGYIIVLAGFWLYRRLRGRGQAGPAPVVASAATDGGDDA